MGEIERLISSTRSRLYKVRALTCAIETVCGLALVLLLGALTLPYADSFGGPILTQLISVGLILSLAVRLIWSTYLPWRNDEAVAQYLERSQHVAQGILSAVQLKRAMAVQSPELRGISPNLMFAHLESTAQGIKISGVTPRKVVPVGPVNWRLAILALIGVLWASAFGMLSDRMTPGLSAILFQAGPSLQRAQAIMMDEPIVGDLSIGYTYPSYTDLEPTEVEQASGFVRGVRGTIVHLRTRSLGAVVGATLILELEDEPPARLDMDVEGERDLSVTFAIVDNGRYRISLKRADGAVVAERQGRRIDAIEDTAPVVELLQPETDDVVDSNSSVDVRFVARDDYGITGAKLILEHQDGYQNEDWPLLMAIGGRQADGETILDLSSLGLSGGERLCLHVEVSDNDTVTGPKAGRSAQRCLMVFSQVDRHMELTARQRRVWEKLLDSLADRLEAQMAFTDLAQYPDLQKTLTHLQDGLASLLGEMGSLIAALEEDPLVEADVFTAFTSAQARLQKGHRKEAEQLRLAEDRHKGESLQQGHLTALRLTGEQIVEELEGAAIHLDRLINRQSLKDVRSMADELLKAQARLRQLVDEYGKAPDEETKRQLLREIERLSQRVRTMMAMMAQASGRVPFEHVNKDAFGDQSLTDGMSGLQSSLENLKKMVEAGDVEALMKELESLDQGITGLVAALDKDLGAYEDSELGATRKEMAAIMEELNQIHQQQESLAQNTQHLDEEARKRHLESIREKLDSVLERSLQKVKEAQDILEQVPAGGLPNSELNAFDVVNSRVEGLKSSLEIGDLEQSVEAAREAQMALRGLAHTLKAYSEAWDRMGSNRAKTRERRQATEHMVDASSLVREVYDDLQSLAQSSGEPGQCDQGQLGRTGKQQEGIRGRTRRLQERMETLGQESPLSLGEGEQQPLGQAESHMEAAGDRLKQGSAREASREMRNALERLGSAKDQMQQQMGGQQEAGSRSGGMGRRPEDTEVKIPRADQYRAPKEFREDILEAMGQGWPEEYREQIKKYYEDIIR